MSVHCYPPKLLKLALSNRQQPISHGLRSLFLSPLGLPVGQSLLALPSPCLSLLSCVWCPRSYFPRGTAQLSSMIQGSLVRGQLDSSASVNQLAISCLADSGPSDDKGATPSGQREAVEWFSR